MNIVIIDKSLIEMILQEQRITDMVSVKVRLAQGVDSYVIRDVSAADEGRYFCRATNVIGSREAPVDVRMIGEYCDS